MDKNCLRRLLIALAVLLPQVAAAENGVTKDRIVLGQSVALCAVGVGRAWHWTQYLATSVAPRERVRASSTGSTSPAV